MEVLSSAFQKEVPSSDRYLTLSSEDPGHHLPPPYRLLSEQINKVLQL